MDHENTTKPAHVTPPWFDVKEETSYRWTCALCGLVGVLEYRKYDDMLDGWDLHETTGYHIRSVELNGHQYDQR